MFNDKRLFVLLNTMFKAVPRYVVGSRDLAKRKHNANNQLPGQREIDRVARHGLHMVNVNGFELMARKSSKQLRASAST